MASSGMVAHRHLLACLNTAVPRGAGTIRILDVGCGDGRLIQVLQAGLPALRRGLSVELHGLDVADAGVQAPGFLDRATASLRERFPDVPWADRIRLLLSGSPWPFPDRFFDFVVSNQVLEHLADHGHVLQETGRVLAPGGRSFHLFPLRQCAFESHLLLPFAHWISDNHRAHRYILWCSRLGIGKYVQHRKARPGLTAESYAAFHAEYLRLSVHYPERRQLLDLARKAALRPSFRFTTGFYAQKARLVTGREALPDYGRHSVLANALLFPLLSRASCVTLCLEKASDAGRGGN